MEYIECLLWIRLSGRPAYIAQAVRPFTAEENKLGNKISKSYKNDVQFNQHIIRREEHVNIHFFSVLKSLEMKKKSEPKFVCC